MAPSEARAPDPPDPPEFEALVVDSGVSAEAVDMDPDVVDDDVEDDPDSVEAEADLTDPDEEEDEDEVLVRAELVSPDTRPLVILVRDWGDSSTAETFTEVWAELDDALSSAPDDEDPPEPLKVAAADSDVLVRVELDFDALEVVEVEAATPEDESSVFVGLEADSRGLDALAVESLDADALD